MRKMDKLRMLPNVLERGKFISVARFAVFIQFQNLHHIQVSHVKSGAVKFYIKKYFSNNSAENFIAMFSYIAHAEKDNIGRIPSSFCCTLIFRNF